MEYGEEFKILGIDWALIHFVENNGMAFGLSLGGEYGKLVLSVFRIIAVGFLVYYLNFLLNSGAKRGILISFSLILAGAIGNIIDSAFYGLIFSESTYHGGLAKIFPEAGGYATFLHGKVVDLNEKDNSCIIETMSGKLKFDRSAISMEMSKTLNKPPTEKK